MRQGILRRQGASLIYHDSCPNNLSRHQQRSLRSQRKLLLHSNWPRNSKFERSYAYKAIKLWNQLPEDYKRIRDIDKFKLRATKEMLLGNLNFPE